MKRAWIIPVVILVCVGGSSADVLVELHDEPLVGAAVELQKSTTAPVGGLVAASPKSTVPEAGYWFIPLFEADMVVPGDSTYFSVRNESLAANTVLLEYFDVFFGFQTDEAVELAPHEIRSVALRNVAGLAVDPDGYARGLVRINSLLPVSVDSFQLETRNAFAVGGLGWVIGDFCSQWHTRFLRFGAAGGTRLVFLVNGPLGGDPGDPVTISGDVYTENGDFINSFTVRTDEWFFGLAVHDFVLGGVDFGTVELVINSSFAPAGLVEVRHQALGEFSVGYPAVCAD
jgi:hypothetical protein